jgi:hypothetical protein
MLFLSSPQGMGIAPIFELSVVNERELSLLFLPRLHGFGTNESQPQDAIDDRPVIPPLPTTHAAPWEQRFKRHPRGVGQLPASNQLVPPVPASGQVAS